MTLRQHRHQHVDLVVVGDRHDGFGVGDVGFFEQVGVEGVAVEDDRVFQAVGDEFGARLVVLDEFEVCVRPRRLDLPRQHETDIAAADQQQAARRLLLVAEQGHGARHLAGFGDEIDFVSRQQLLHARRIQRAVAAQDRDDGDVEVGEQFAELAQRRIDHRATVAQAHADEARPVVGEPGQVQRPRHIETAGYGARHLDFRRDDGVYGHVRAAEQRPPRRFEIGLLADARDLGGHVEQRMPHLARHDVDLVGLGDGDQHVRLARSGPFENVGMRGETDHRLHVEAVAHLADALRRVVDDDDIVVLGGELASDVVADLSGAAHQNSHRPLPGVTTPCPGPICRAISACGGAPTAPCRRRTPCARYCARNAPPAPADIPARTLRAPCAAAAP